MLKLAKDTNLDDGVHVIKFFATWCGPCKLYAPVVKRASERYEDVNFYEVDIDQQPEIRDQYGVQAVPTTLVIRDEKEYARVIGAKSSQQVDALLTEALNYSHANST